MIECIAPIPSIKIRQGGTIVLPVGAAFRGDRLQFGLINCPSWLEIDSCSGLLMGTAPPVKADQQFLIKVKVFNGQDDVRRYFFIKVLKDSFLDEHRKVTSSLSMRREYLPTKESLYETFSILDYIFAYYEAGEYREMFEHLIREEAKKQGIELGDKITSKDFERVIKARNPSVGESLRELNEFHFLTEAEINTADLRNMFREGSQQQGVHPIAVWNYLGAPERYIWTSVVNVLRLASHHVLELKQENREEFNEEYYSRTMFSPR